MKITLVPVAFLMALSIDKTKVLMENGSLMEVENIAECFKGSILQYF